MFRTVEDENSGNIVTNQNTLDNLFSDPQELNLGNDSIKVKLVTPKLSLPKSNTSSKLRKINEKIREVDPVKEIVYQPVVKQEPVLIDTTEHALFDPDSILFLRESYSTDDVFTQYYLYNIPDYKPFVALVDSTEIVSKEILVETKGNASERENRKEFTELLDQDNALTYQEIFKADWIPAFLIVLFLLVAWIRVFYNKVLKLSIRSVFNSLIANRLFRERNSLTLWGGFMLNVLFFLVGGFFTYLVLVYFGYSAGGYSGFLGFIFVTAALLLVYIVKFLIVKLVGTIFQENSGASEYLHSVFIFNKTFALFILPLVVAIPYVPEPGKEIIIKAGLVLLALLYLSRIFRGIRIGIKINLSIYYMILYLCSLEFFPLLILYKLFGFYTA